ncbi:MAG: ABC transporter ATP-binding protein [Spirochaetes bacterium]|nr:ABC transporter ATP-binding protein [Spirochaetota bacterium]
MYAIRIIGVEKNFGEVIALSNIHLEIEKGEFFTLLGPSGCGKTTLLRTIAGFCKQDKGDIYIEDELINEVPAYQRNTAMVFQNYAVFPHMTVFDNVAYGLRVRKLTKEVITQRVRTALKSVHLEGFEDRTPDKLSGGQQQRVGLARAMAIEPRVLLFDEPLSNLDAKLRIEMREEIKAVQKSLGITSIYVTHDQEEALVISDRIAVMNQGRIQQVGKPWEIYRNPQNTFVASFVGKINMLTLKLGPGAGLRYRQATTGKVSLNIPAQGTEQLDSIIVAFRPEDVVEVSSKDRSNTITGFLRTVSFMGSIARFEVDVEGQLLTIDRHRPRELDIPPIHSQITFSVPPESILLFDPSSGKRLAQEERP